MFWRNTDDATIANFRDTLRTEYVKFLKHKAPNEATTERDLIDPIIGALGWTDYLTQQTTSKKGREDIPDYLLFESASHKEAAVGEKDQADRFRHGTLILEAKAWNIPLDRKNGDMSDGVPSNQILRYLDRVSIRTDGKLKWGILTNGRYWRLYYQDAKSRSEEFLSLDLPLILGLEGFEHDLLSQEEAKRQDWLKVFYCLFRREAFQQQFHEYALKEGQHWEEKVAQSLSDVVFAEVFPNLAKALAAHDPQAPAILSPEYLAELREAVLILLYRLLFLLYAEDRNLLPASEKRYDDYGLRKRVREDIKRRLDVEQDIFSKVSANYYRHVLTLCELVDKGDTSIGLPPYNGGLFDSNRSPLLKRASIPDDDFVPIFDKLSRQYGGDMPKWINFRDLSVQQLGSIYERFLEFEVAQEKGTIIIRPNIFARKTSGSYYTPETLVNLIIEKTVGSLVEERIEAFRAKADELKSARTPKAERMQQLTLLDPAEKILELRICDPAMGSGHFLVSLVDWLADHVLIAMEEAEKQVEWASDEVPYISPVASSIRRIREHISAQAQENNWIIAEEQLDDRHIIRRMILKRCVFGVDKNPMAVELAKVSLWLHTFTVGAPLSFLDHHLRCGDSLFGEFTRDVMDELHRKGAAMFIGGEVAKAKAAAEGIAMIERITDADIAEAKTSAAKFATVAEAVRPISCFYSFIHATRWLVGKDKQKQQALADFFDGIYGDPVQIAVDKKHIEKSKKLKQQSLLPDDKPQQQDLMRDNTSQSELREVFLSLYDEAAQLATEENFLHWEIAFPTLWEQWENKNPQGGFDAIIGNPPWDRMKMQEVEWFGARKPEIAKSSRASDRKKLIDGLKKSGDPLWNAYQKASHLATAASEVARSNGHYPLLSGGDINLYSLFVERAHRLIHPKGMVGLLVPSGIASDLGASKFFKEVAGKGKLAHFYDFENKKVFFPDVHASFKFAAYVAGGKQAELPPSQLAFFLHDVEELKDENRCFALTAEDFLRVNPNTGTAPIFRTRRDAEITRRIYERFPVLVHHSDAMQDSSEMLERLNAEGAMSPQQRKAAKKAAEEAAITRAWPVKYSTMFHMTNDSHLFKTREELDKDECYPVPGNRLKKGEEEWLPLYVGKMIHHYNHRAASVTVNEENLNVAASSLNTTPEQYKDPHFGIAPQYYVEQSHIKFPEGLEWAIGFRDITNSTNERTMVSTIIPAYPCNNKLPLLLPLEDDGVEDYKQFAPFLSANLASLAFDFVARKKIQATNLNWFIVEQLPVITPAAFEAKLGKITVGDFVRDCVLRLTYTAWDMQPFARDMGYEGDPFRWDEEERRHLRARLDALFFMLYGIEEDDIRYILDTFPIVKKKDEEEFGTYRTRDLILGYRKALKAGDTTARIAA